MNDPVLDLASRLICPANYEYSIYFACSRHLSFVIKELQLWATISSGKLFLERELKLLGSK